MKSTLRWTRIRSFGAAIGMGAVVTIAAACSGGGAAPDVVVITSIVEVQVPGETIVSVVTQTSIVEVTVTMAPDPKANWPDTLVFGVVTREVTGSLQGDMSAFAAAMSERLGIRVVVIVRPDEARLAAVIGNGSVDMAPLSPTRYITAAQELTNLELLAQQVQFGDATYHGQWFTNDPSICGADPVEGAFYYDEAGTVRPVGPTDGPALQVGWNADKSRDPEIASGLACPQPVDLSIVAGQKIAFTTETSAIGHIVPVLQLRQAGITSDQYETSFAGGHDSAVTAVYEGTANVGVAYDDARRISATFQADVGSKVILFNITPRIANDVFVARSELADSLRQAVAAELQDYVRSEEGQLVMSGLFGWADLTRADSATMQSLATVADAMRELGFTD